MGKIALAPHQIDAVVRINAALEEFGGALLCDAVGAGKTFVGLAVARGMGNALIIAPAALREMWIAAMHSTEVHCPIVSTESLSKRTPNNEDCDCVIVDEAHHFRNGATLRYRSLSAFVGDRPILLITATPIHNSRRDLESLASLFLGVKSHHLTEAELARLIVRREKGDIVGSAKIPDVGATEWWNSGDSPELVDALMALPPPVPFRDSGVAERLTALGLLRQWASSEAALAAALKRRLARGVALEVSLAAGEYPTAREMRSWITGDDAVQLGFPGFLAPPSNDAGIDSLLSAVRVHDAALREVATRLGSTRALDDGKCEKLRELSRQFAGEPMIAFASYDATVTAFFRRLCAAGHVAAITSKGGLIASGSISRREIECQFAPDSPTERESRRIDLLLTTDLLSEGVNLQRARAVVHLDIPWTSARMDQRVGRIARIGSRHQAVRIFGFRPPTSCECVLRVSAIVTSKWQTASAVVGTAYDHGLSRISVQAEKPTSEIHESLRVQMRRWVSADSVERGEALFVATVHATQSGFLALVEENGGSLLVAGGADGISDSLADVNRVAVDACGPDLPLDHEMLKADLKKLRAWLLIRESKTVAGIADGASLHTRRKFIARINSLASRLPLHQRMEKEALVTRARRFASSTHGAGRERLLADPADDLGALERLADADIRMPRAEGTVKGCYVRALLILDAPTPAPSS